MQSKIPKASKFATLYYHEPLIEGGFHVTVNTWFPLYLAKVFSSEIICFFGESLHSAQVSQLMVACAPQAKIIFSKYCKFGAGLINHLLGYFARLLSIVYKIVSCKSCVHVIATCDYSIAPFLLLLAAKFSRSTTIIVVIHKPLKLCYVNPFTKIAWRKLVQNSNVKLAFLHNVAAKSIDRISSALGVMPQYIVADATKVEWPFLNKTFSRSDCVNKLPLAYCSPQDYQQLIHSSSLVGARWHLDPVKNFIYDKKFGNLVSRIFMPSVLYSKDAIAYLHDLDICDFVVVNLSRESEYMFASGMRTDAEWARKQILEC